MSIPDPLCDCPDAEVDLSELKAVEVEGDDGWTEDLVFRSCVRCGALFVRHGTRSSWTRVEGFLAVRRDGA